MNTQILASYLRPRVRHSRWAWVSALILVTVGSGLGIEAYRLYQSAQQSITRNNKALAAKNLAVVPAPNHLAQEEQKRWAALKVERDFPWAALFQAVERAANVNIELLEFQPDKTNRRIVLRGEARDLKALIAYLDALTKQPALTQVHLVHQETVVRERLETVGFEMKATLVE